MSIEVFLVKRNCYAPAIALDVVSNSGASEKCKCKLLISNEELTVEGKHIRLPPPPSDEPFHPGQGDEVEVRSDSDVEPGGESTIAHPCWWLATVTVAKGDFYHVKYKGWEKRFDEIVELDRLRAHSKEAHIQFTIEKHMLPVPDALKEWVHNVDNLREHVKEKCGAMGIALAKPKGKGGRKGDQGVMLMLLGTRSAYTKAEMLLKLHAKHQIGLRSLKDKAAELEHTLESERQKRGNSVVERFSIDPELIGMIVGKKGANIRKAESDSGVHSAQVENGEVVIHGPDQDSVAICRSMLEMVKEEVEVAQGQLGWIIGARGSNIRELMSETGVNRAVVKKDQPPTLEIIGTQESVENAKLWLQCHTDYLEEIEHQESDIGHLRQELDDTSFSRSGQKGKGRGKGNDRGYQGGYAGNKGGGRGDRNYSEAPRGEARGEARGGAGGRGRGGGSLPAPAAPRPAPAPKQEKPAPAPKAAPKAKPAADAPAPKPKNNNAPAPKPKPNNNTAAAPAAAPAPKPKPNNSTAAPKDAAIPKPLEGAGAAKPQRARKAKN